MGNVVEPGTVTVNLAETEILKVEGRGPRTVDPATDQEHRPTHYAPLLPGEHWARRATQSNPGRYSDVELSTRPSKLETPYRSRLFVTGRHSADGNAYGVGEPIPEVEARRQAMVLEEEFSPIVDTVNVIAAAAEGEVAVDVEAETLVQRSTLDPISTVTVEKPREVRTTCSKCEGHGKSPKMVVRHGPAIGHCPACRPCSDCGGRGFLIDQTSPKED
jgi:hypothetical protein